MSTWTEQELNEQPEALQRFLDAEVERVLQLVPSLMSDDVKYIVVAARGTSDNAARYLQYLLGVFNRLPVMLDARYRPVGVTGDISPALVRTVPL